MHILVVGGTGFVGSYLVPELCRRGWRCTVLAASEAPVGPGASLRVGDRRDPAVLKALCADGPFDAAVDLIAYDPRDSIVLLESVGARIGRFVHLSTVSVYRGSRDLRVVEDCAVRWETPEVQEYGPLKAACERVVEASASEPVIIRSAPLFGVGDPVSREGFIVERLARGAPLLVPGDPEAMIPMLWVRDLVRTLIEAVERPGAAGHAMHVAQAERLTFADHVQAIGGILGVEPVLWGLAPTVLADHGMNPYAFPYGPLAGRAWLDCSSAADLLGFRPTNYQYALRETIDWLQEQDMKTAPVWPGRASRPGRLAGISDALYAELESELLDALNQRKADPEAMGSVDAGPAALAPERLMDVLVGWGGENPGRIVVPTSWWRGSVRPSPQSAQPIQGRIEPDPEVPERAWLHCRDIARRARGYRNANSPPPVTRIGFGRVSGALAGELDWPDGPPEGYWLVTWSAADDRCALRIWLQDACARGGATLPAAPHRAHIWMERESELVVGGAATELDLDPSAGLWAGALTAGRLLTRAGALAPEPVDVQVEAVGSRNDMLLVTAPSNGRFALLPGVPRAWSISEAEWIGLAGSRDDESASGGRAPVPERCAGTFPAGRLPPSTPRRSSRT